MNRKRKSEEPMPREPPCEKRVLLEKNQGRGWDFTGGEGTLPFSNEDEDYSPPSNQNKNYSRDHKTPLPPREEELLPKLAPLLLPDGSAPALYE